MAKSTNAQEAATGTPDSYTERELNDPEPPVVITRAELGGEKKWTERVDGTDSSESSKSDSGTTTKNPAEFPSNVPMTEKHSQQDPTEADAAHSITTSGQEEAPPGTVELEEVEPYDQWDYADLQAECKNRGLTATGKKEELISRLEEWDEANPE